MNAKKSAGKLPRQVGWILFAMGLIVGGWLGWRLYQQRFERAEQAGLAGSGLAGSGLAGSGLADADRTGEGRTGEDVSPVNGPGAVSGASGETAQGGAAGNDLNQPAESPSDPAPSDPAPRDPAPSDPAPSDPAPTAPQPGGQQPNGQHPVDQQPVATAADHPLDPALEMAREGLERIRAEVRDYTAKLTKRERISGRIVEQKMAIKVRQPREEDAAREEDSRKVPMSVYLKFLAPAGVAGREVIWVKGENKGKLVAHEGGLKNLLRVYLPPDSMLAMIGNRYPITEIGIENLIVKLIERGERDKLLGDCEVKFLDEMLGDRACQVIEVTHPEKEPQFDFYQARIFIDKELQVPVRYTAYVWPKDPKDDPLLDEEYIYEDMKLNVGLTDKDFDPNNEAYEFP